MATRTCTGPVDPDQFGIAVAFPDGAVLSAGDAEVPFSIQSVSKVFTLAIALGRRWATSSGPVGREPGNPFNSIVQLEQEHRTPRNPFINAGAIAVTDAILDGCEPKEIPARSCASSGKANDPTTIHINKAVARPEAATGDRNYALAHFMRGWQVEEHARADAGHLFPPMRGRDELRAAGPLRPVPDRRAGLAADRTDRSGGSVRS